MNNEDLWRIFAALVVGVLAGLFVWKQNSDKALYLQCLERNEVLALELAKKGAVVATVHFCRP